MELLRLTGSHGPHDLWVCFAVLIAVGLGYVANIITNGLSFGYQKIPIGNTFKATLTTIHVFGSIVTAFVLPNNYLNKFDYFHKLYEQNGLWIPASMLVIFFVLVLVVGIFATLLAKQAGKKKEPKS
ncbi:MAG: hypothetical protein HYZ14_10460 [Bacteroidetes bacterium]|nr:hypothetical protein [Bacteroidota bacterium]